LKVIKQDNKKVIKINEKGLISPFKRKKNTLQLSKRANRPPIKTRRGKTCENDEEMKGRHAGYTLARESMVI
jgi:hypothetical protein